MSVKNIQHDFIEGIFGGDASSAVSHVIGDDKLTAEQRFGIYSGSVHGILTQTLGLIFSVCKDLVGEQFFTKMAKEFIDEHPPTTSYFAEYGALFPTFSSTFEPVKGIPYFHDIARLEWARHDSWYQKEEALLELSTLGSIAEEQQGKVVFNLSKTVHLIKSDFRIDDIWFAHQEDVDSPAFESIEINSPVKLAIYKEKNLIKISTMSETKADSTFWNFLSAISKGTSLEALAEEFGESLPEQLNQAIQGGWISSFK